ncbi:hypothetical protein IB286_02060 [Spongiibacter sp. KMU-158]|uniref:Carboxypeptidase regulatory-like domain-containing protein n=1 Tax=Spongiibacter pelagi TaxID=2760804 RepID=A0A927BY94_9GAMM|nr:hypothetical protein [Spongiibacter pelagi]MBD2857774.1 hypothetical protein [Spongiibacter pelagi]
MTSNSNHFKKLLLPLAVSATLAACGGGGGGGGSSASTTVGGGTNKGIIKGGIVNAYAFAVKDDGTIDKGTMVATETTTDSKGKYTLTLNSNYQEGDAIYIEITAADGTVMVCDLVNCDIGTTTYAFGQDYPLDKDTFSMSAVLPKATKGEGVSVNVTPLTNAAAALAAKSVHEEDIDPSSAASISNGKVANALGIPGGSIISQGIVDLTDPESVNAADADTLSYNLKAAAVVQAGKGTGTVEDALSNFTEQFSDIGLAKNDGGSPDANLTLAEIFAAADQILDKVDDNEEVNAGEGSALKQSGSDIGAEKTVAENSEDTTPSQGEAPTDIELTGLPATKAFVRQIRNLANANISTTKGQDNFADEAQLVSDTIDGEAEATTFVLALGMEALGEAVAFLEENKGDEPQSLEDYEYLDQNTGLTVVVNFNKDTEELKLEIADAKVSFTSVDEYEVITSSDPEVSDSEPVGQKAVAAEPTTEPVEVTLSLTAHNQSVLDIDDQGDNLPDDQEDGTSYTAQSTANIDFALFGSSTAGDTSFEITENSVLSGSLVYNEDYEYYENDDEHGRIQKGDVTATDLKAKLEASLTNGDAKFVGSFEISLGDAKFVYDESTNDQHVASEVEDDGWQTTGIDDVIKHNLTANDLSIVLSGEFSNASDSLLATLSLSASNFYEECTYTETDNWDGKDDAETSECSEETESKFVSASVSLIFTLNLDGVDDDAEVKLSGMRTGLEDGTLDIDLSYNGNSLSLDFDSEKDTTTETTTEDENETTRIISRSFTVTNHNGVKLVLTETYDEEDNGTVTGKISHGGEQYATVDEEGIVRYTDETFESAL